MMSRANPATTAAPDKPLKASAHYAHPERGWPSPARRWIAIPSHLWERQTSSVRKDSGVQIPLPALVFSTCPYPDRSFPQCVAYIGGGSKSPFLQSFTLK